MKKIFLTLFITITIVTGTVSRVSAQKKKPVKNQVKEFVQVIDEKMRGLNFVIKGNPRFEIQNEKLNVSVLSEANNLFEVTGIDERAIKDTAIFDGAFKASFIRSQTEKTFVTDAARSNSLLTIKCIKTKEGKRLEITVITEVFNDLHSLRIQALFVGIVPQKRQTSTKTIVK